MQTAESLLSMCDFMTAQYQTLSMYTYLYHSDTKRCQKINQTNFIPTRTVIYSRTQLFHRQATELLFDNLHGGQPTPTPI